MHKIIIIGSGPAGHTAAIYAARSGLEPLMFEGFLAGGVAAGGQLTTTTIVENFPGFPKGIDGNELMQQMREQSINSGTKIITETVTRVELGKHPFIVRVGDKSYETQTLIIATGATAKRLHIPGEEVYRQKGISACAICDGALPFFRNKHLAVVGGGDTAMEEALHLTHFASKISIIVRKDTLRASQIMQNRAQENDKIEFIRNTEVQEALGDGNMLTGLKLWNNQSQQSSELEVGGLFYAIGHTPNTSFLDNQISLDDTGYIVVQPATVQTNIPGVFACGDVQDRRYRQAITSAGTGCMAAMDAEKRLTENKLN